jgi:acyl-CoA reductase-like NAD-dependent aldehyde dehydrogenase
MEQRRFVSLAEAATIASTSIDTIRRKLRKGELLKAQTNKKGVFIDLASLREAFDLPSNAGQTDDAREKAATAEAAMQEMVKALEAALAEMRLQTAQTGLKHRDELATLETKLAIADTLAQQRQAEIERLHELCRASAVQVPGIRTALRQWIARRLAA